MHWFRVCLAVSLFFYFTPTSLARKGGASDGGGGGDPRYSMEFSAIAQELFGRLERQPIEGVNLKKLTAAVRATKINSTDKELRDRNGDPADALNFPLAKPPRIVLNRAAWERLKEVPLGRMRLVLHEYLGILKVDDAGYRISNVLNKTRACERSPSVRKTLEARLHLACDRIELRDLAAIKVLAFAGGSTHLSLESTWGGISENGLIGTPSPFGLEQNYKAIDFQQLTGLQGLELANLAKLEKGVLDDLENLRVLSIASVRLAEIAPGSFSKLRSLKKLYISTNTSPISDHASVRVHANSFAGLSSVREFVLFTTRTFEGDLEGMGRSLEKLENLKLKLSEPEDLAPSFFTGLKNLKTFDFFMPRTGIKNEQTETEFLRSRGFVAPQWKCERKIGFHCERVEHQ